MTATHVLERPSTKGLPIEQDVARVHRELVEDLLTRRNKAGHWRGRLASSALSTAVASFALTLFDRMQGSDQHGSWIEGGLDWLAEHPNGDGGWGDTRRSESNLPTTLLSWAALKSGPVREHRKLAIGRAEDWIRGRAGSLQPEDLKRTVEELYGKDKTFSVPILTLAALAGVLGPEPEAWQGPPALPFELAVFPQGMFRFLGLPVVSYALPALIAVGQVRHSRAPSGHLPLRWIRQSCRAKTLDRLQSVLPSSGGFLEAIPLTAFVTLSLVGAGEAEHPVTGKCLEFLRGSVRPDGAWPIDIDLATWVTTLSIQGLGAGGDLQRLPQQERQALRSWLLGQQYKERHPFTGAAPGGWAWTDLSGGVPDADDTAGALLALHALGPIDDEATQSAENGMNWLMGLQNRDGGFPTFCRGWTQLPFDASAPDLTAHALRAFQIWRPHMGPSMARKIDRSVNRALAYLQREQQADGSWVPLWFGHEAAPERQNKVFGTARVLRAFDQDPHRPWVEPGRRYLLSVQNCDGGWGGGKDVPSSVEETALAVAALAGIADTEIHRAVARGARYLVSRWDADRFAEAAPIGFYFANLWYFEDLYPHTFALSALGAFADESG